MKYGKRRKTAERAGCGEARRPLHTFAVCAYGDSPYLEACLRSLSVQTVPSRVILCTSTPSPFLEGLAGKYGILYYVRRGKSNIREDWLFAYRKAEGRLVTIAHQDDIYRRNYVEELLRAYGRYPDMTVFVSDYVTLKMTEHGGRLEPLSSVWAVKKLLRLPLRLRFAADREWIKKSSLCFGNALCCPACTYNKEQIGDDMFHSAYDFALDWDNLYELAGKKGRFVCTEKPLLAYRVHEDATTRACIEDDRRRSDELAMFRKLWPDWMACVLMRFYQKAYDEYEEES